MTFTPASPLSLTAFLVVVVAVIAFTVGGLYWATRRSGQADSRPVMKALIGIVLWNILIAGIVSSGAIEAAVFPRLPLFFMTMNLAGLFFALSSFGRLLAAGVPIAWLVAFQGFRLPLELVLHSWATQGTIPETMTWTGQNWDILTGVVALAAAPFVSKSRPLAWAVNGLGFALLLNVGRVAMLSSPLPFGWNVQPPLLLALHLPYAWIGSVCVAGALAGHVILTRALLLRR